MQKQQNPIFEIAGHKTGSHQFKKSFSTIESKQKFESNTNEANKRIEIKNQDISDVFQPESKEELYKNLGIILESEKENLENNSDLKYQYREQNITFMEEKIQELRRKREELNNKLSQKEEMFEFFADQKETVSNNNLNNLKLFTDPEINNLEEIISSHKEKLRDLETKYFEQRNLKTNPNVSMEKIKNPNLIKTVKFVRPKSSIARTEPKYKIDRQEYKEKFMDKFENKVEKTLTYAAKEKKIKIKNQEKLLNPRKQNLIKLRKEEKELMQLFFDEIPKENNLISKDDVIKYLLSNPKLTSLYDLDPNEIEYNLDIYLSKKERFLDFNEFVDFLKNNQSLAKTKLIKGSRNSSPSPVKNKIVMNSESNICLLQKKELDLLHRKFMELDSHNDYFVPLKDYAEKLRKDNEIFNLLPLPIIYLAKYSKFLTLHRFLYILESESLSGTEEEVQNKEYISWNVFRTTLKNFVPKKYLTRLNNPLTEDEMVADLKNDAKKLLVDVYNQLNGDNLNNHTIFFETKEIVKMFQNYNRYHLINDSNVRVDERGKGENLKEILERILSVADQYVDLDEFLEFFTRRGQPQYFEISPSIRKIKLRERIDNLENKNNENYSLSPKQERSPLLKKFPSPEKYDFENQVMYSRSPSKSPSERSINGYDSDPEYRFKRPPRSPSKGRLHSTSFHNEQEKIREKKKSAKKGLSVTIPDPFLFEYPETNKEIKINKGETEYQTTFKANPVPDFVKENLFVRLTDEQILRRNEVKKNSKIATLQNERPFSFYKRDIQQNVRKKNNYERKQFIFKANPVPWYCSTKMMGILKEEEETRRKEKITREAQISLSKAKLPNRMEKYKQEKKVIELKYGKERKIESSKNFRLPIPKEVPNFNNLHKTFETMLENKRRCVRATVPVSPRFNESKRPKKNELLDQENEFLAKTMIQKKEKKIDYTKPPAILPSSTKKWEQALEKTKIEREKKKEERKKREKEEEERQLKKIKIKERVQNSSTIKESIANHYSKNNKYSESIKQSFKDQTAKYNQIKKEMEERIINRPLLVETPLERDIKLDKMKRLISLSKMLKERGINYKSVFSPEEQEMMADIDFMRKNNYDIQSLESSFIRRKRIV